MPTSLRVLDRVAEKVPDDDLDAMGAIEAVGSTRGFGPLPQGWTDDVLIVYFTFDYALRPN